VKERGPVASFSTPATVIESRMKKNLTSRSATFRRGADHYGAIGNSPMRELRLLFHVFESDGVDLTRRLFRSCSNGWRVASARGRSAETTFP